MKKVLKANVIRICKNAGKDLEVDLGDIKLEIEYMGVDKYTNRDRYDLYIRQYAGKDYQGSMPFYDLNCEQVVILANDLINAFSKL